MLCHVRLLYLVNYKMDVRFFSRINYFFVSALKHSHLILSFLLRRLHIIAVVVSVLNVDLTCLLLDVYNMLLLFCYCYSSCESLFFRIHLRFLVDI